MSNAKEVIDAVQSGNVERLRNLLDENPKMAASRDAAGVSALMHAVYRRQKDAIELLQQAGLNLDIFEATALGDVQSLAALVTRQPSLVNTYSADGFTALHFAGFFSQPSAARLLLERGADHAAVARNPTQVTPLHSAASGGNLQTVGDLLAKGAPVNARQQHGWTALHSAAQSGNLEMVNLLLQRGADPGIQNDEGVTALDLAQKQNRTDVANRLTITQSS